MTDEQIDEFTAMLGKALRAGRDGGLAEFTFDRRVGHVKVSVEASARWEGHMQTIEKAAK